MKIYKGSKLNMNPFEPQPVHSDDFHKFPEPIPSKVIFASSSEKRAKIFAIFSGITSFGTSTTSDKSQIYISIKKPIKQERLKEEVYIYTFDSETDGWKYIPESGEWYNCSKQIPIGIQKNTREELLKELEVDPEISIEEDFKEKESMTIS